MLVDLAAGARGEQRGQLGEQRLEAQPLGERLLGAASLGALLKSEVDKWTPIIRKTGVYAD